MKHWWKWLLGVFTCIVVSIAALTWYFSKHWEPIIELKLKELVHSSSKGLYKLKYESMAVNISFGNIAVRGVELIPDTIVYQQQVQDSIAPDKQFYVELDALKIKNISFTDIIFNRKLTIGSIDLEKPQIQVFNTYHSYNDTPSSKPKESFYSHIKTLLNSLSVRKLDVDSVSFSYTDNSKGKNSSISFTNMNIRLEDILIDSLSMQDTTRLFYTKEIDISVPGYEYNLPDSLYKVAFDNLHINTKGQFVLLENIRFRPRMNQAGFFRTVNKNLTMVNLKFDKLQLNDFDFRTLLDKGQALGSSVDVLGGKASFYQDKRYPIVLENKVKKDPYHQIMNVKSKFHFDTVYVKNVSVSYSEYSALFNKEGVITFTDASGNLSNVTNDTTLLNKDRFMKADLSANVMNAGKLHVKFGFDMLSKNGGYTYVGNLSPMSATAFNRILVPLVNVQIPSGNIHSVSFNMQATNFKNWGSVKFNYSDLRVNVLGKPVEGEKDKNRKVVSFLLNKVLINSSNPDSHGVSHVGEVQYTRVPEYSFFKTIWQSLLQGIVQCAGISPEKEERLMNLATTSGKAVSGVKGAAEKIGQATKTIGKDIGKAVNKTDSFFNKVFRKRDKKEKEM